MFQSFLRRKHVNFGERCEVSFALVSPSCSCDVMGGEGGGIWGVVSGSRGAAGRGHSDVNTDKAGRLLVGSQCGETGLNFHYNTCCCCCRTTPVHPAPLDLIYLSGLFIVLVLVFVFLPDSTIKHVAKLRSVAGLVLFGAAAL